MLFGVFDGHGGHEVARYAKENFMRVFNNQKLLKEKKYTDELFTSTFMDLDKEL